MLNVRSSTDLVYIVYDVLSQLCVNIRRLLLIGSGFRCINLGKRHEVLNTSHTGQSHLI
jgi:hypothetical protein